MQATPPPIDLPPVISPPLESPAPTPRWRWWVHLVLINSYLLLAVVAGQTRMSAKNPALTHTPRGLLLICAIDLSIFAVIYAISLLASRASRDDLLLRWRRGILPVPLGIGYSIALRLGLAIMVAAVSAVLILSQLMTPESLQNFFTNHRPQVETVVDIAAMRQNPVYYWLTITVVSFVLAGLREELWRSAVLAAMRALWPKQFLSRTGQIVAVALISIGFGMAHLRMGLLAVIMAGLLGFGLGVIMVIHRSVWPAVIAHGMFDATSMALIPLATETLQHLQKSMGH